MGFFIIIILFFYITIHGVRHFFPSEQASQKPHSHQDKYHHTVSISQKGKSYRGRQMGSGGQEGVQQLQQPQNRRKLLSVCSTLRTYISLIYH